MTKQPKNDWIGARVDEELKEQVEEYIENSDMTMGQLLRKAVVEYMAKHKVTEN